MSSLMHKLISPQQAAYIKGRNIQDQIALASEMVNEMKKKRRGGNTGFKLDISQAYDSVSWNFLCQVLLKYGFSESWYKWLCTLFESAKLSIIINGGPNGFFSVGRGLRQGDPLSPTLFLMEDVLSRNISKMENIRWSLGDGKKVSLWFDSWINDTPLIEDIGYTDYVKEHINIKVADIILYGKWNMSGEIIQILSSYTLPEIGAEHDHLIWRGDIKGVAGFGIVIRDHLFQVMGTLSGGIGVASNYIYEVCAVIYAAELAVTWKLQNIIINSDSKTVISEFAENKMSWFVRIRW
ncbi:uncharacterized protein LOC113312297 [Papaver somniferum]|uniref:uncharacterized protein LOC113312297 n=1 Tax=Papaver somniferum TaxID=3469 RepID=UPI000E6F615A|nr:uncharacterized protein LOC113312297 [Papaver somniferum]